MRIDSISSLSDRPPRTLLSSYLFSSGRFWVVRVSFRCAFFELCSHFSILVAKPGDEDFLNGISCSLFWVRCFQIETFEAKIVIFLLRFWITRHFFTWTGISLWKRLPLDGVQSPSLMFFPFGVDHFRAVNAEFRLFSNYRHGRVDCSFARW